MAPDVIDLSASGVECHLFFFFFKVPEVLYCHTGTGTQPWHMFELGQVDDLLLRACRPHPLRDARRGLARRSPSLPRLAVDRKVISADLNLNVLKNSYDRMCL